MSSKYITVTGAREHNLKNINVKLPRDRLVVLTGLSGSGKSSLAFDTIYAEGQRRYVESLSSYARMFLGQMEKPDVDNIDGLSPAISIDQKTTSKNPRSTVGTVSGRISVNLNSGSRRISSWPPLWPVMRSKLPPENLLSNDNRRSKRCVVSA